jgi:hypothetical protein
MNRRGFGHPITNPADSVDKLVDNVIGQLQVAQKVYDPPVWSRPDPNPYPVDYLYSGRLLLALGDTFKDYKIEDNLYDFSFYSAVSYAINCNLTQKNGRTNLTTTEEDFCQRIGINVIVIGPDSNKYRLVMGRDGRDGRDGVDIDLMPFVLIYHSLDDMYYPIVTLVRKESNIHYRRSSNILQKLIVE